jgi:putative transcription antitermination factor YqgF
MDCFVKARNDNIEQYNEDSLLLGNDTIIKELNHFLIFKNIMSILALDLWEKKVWIAIEINNIAFPKKIVSRIELIRELKNIFEENTNYDTIIVWLPYDLYWNSTRQIDKTNKFIEKLKIIFPLKKIIWVDERFTTFEAKNINNSTKNTKKEVDDISASLILESYLNSN